MNQVTVLTEWVNVPNNGHRIRAEQDHPSAGGWSDLSAQPDQNIVPAPNALMAVGIVDDLIFADLEADPAVTVLSSEAVV